MPPDEYVLEGYNDQVGRWSRLCDFDAADVAIAEAERCKREYGAVRVIKIVWNWDCFQEAELTPESHAKAQL